MTDNASDPIGTLLMIREMIKDGAPKSQAYEYIDREVAALRAQREPSERVGWLTTYPANVMRFSDNQPDSKAAIKIERVALRALAPPEVTE